MVSLLQINSPNLLTFRKAAAPVCEKLEANVKFADDVIASDVTLRGKYMRLRHEDFALDPSGAARAVYDFSGIEMTENVLKWLEKATSTKNNSSLSLKDTQSTSRDPSYVVSAWRRKRTLPEVKIIQEECKDSLSLLEYKVFKDAQELIDLDKFKSFNAKNYTQDIFKDQT